MGTSVSPARGGIGRRVGVSARLRRWSAGMALSLLSACAGQQQQPPSAPTPPDPQARLEMPVPVVPEPPDRQRSAIVPPELETIRIAILVPLSGSASEVGTALRDAAALALFDAYDPRLELIPIDTRGTPEGARAAAERAVDEGARVVLGPLLADSISAAAPTLREAEIPLVGFSNDRSAAGPGVYLMGFMPRQEVRRIVSYAASAAHERFAALIPDSAYGERVDLAFGPAVQRSGGEVVSLMRYPPDPDRLAEPVKQLARYEEREAAYEAEVEVLEELGDDLSQEILERLETRDTLGEPGFDAVLVAEGDPLLRTLAPLLPYYDVDPDKVQFLGTGLWDVPDLTREPPLRGGWFPAPEPDRPRAFLARFERVYDRQAPRLATLGYDAMGLVAQLARNPLQSERFTRAAFRDPAGFTGLDGAFRFDESGIAQRKLAVLAIRRDGFEVIDPAPEDFRGPRIGVADLTPKARRSPSRAPRGPAPSP